ncbi:MAG: hypothetical protein Q8904_07290 [Bacteroidota bacterium]|nr:hypothetical protein [Bacteroidota bacterium]
MKKITLFIALFMAWGVNALNAQTLNNPKDANGNQIYKWDCAKDQFATSNDFEIDETVVFAVDVTGTPLEAWLKETPPNAGEIRSIGFVFWTQWGTGGPLDGRFVQIKGNIYGATLNFSQFIKSRQYQNILLQGIATGETTTTNAFTVGTITQIYGNIFGFGYTPTNNGAEWWKLAMTTAVSMNSAAYTGTKTSPEFYNSDYNFFTAESSAWDGYAPPCVVINDIKNTYVSDSPVVGYEYYSLLGGKLTIQPEKGFFIQKAIRADGTYSTTKIFK